MMAEAVRLTLALGPALICFGAMALGGVEAVSGRAAPLMASWLRLWRKLPARARDWRLHGLSLMLTGVLGLLVIATVALTWTELRPPYPIDRVVLVGLWLAQMVTAALLMLAARGISYEPLRGARRRISLD